MLRASVQKRYDTPINMGESFKPGSMAAGQEKRERPFRLIGAVETLPSADHPERNEDHTILSIGRMMVFLAWQMG